MNKRKKIRVITVACFTVISVALVFAVFKENLIRPHDDSNTTTARSSVADKATLATQVFTSGGAEGKAITFFSSNGVVLDRQTVKSGESATPPEINDMNIDKPGHIFVGWDTPLNNITQDEEIKPVYEDIRQQSNVISFPASYGTKGANITLPLSIVGKVEFCAIDMRIAYDKEVLKFIRFDEVDGACLPNGDNEAGVVNLNFVSTQNVTADILFCKLVFQIISNEKEKTQLDIQVVEIVKLNNNNTFIKPEYKLLSPSITIL